MTIRDPGANPRSVRQARPPRRAPRIGPAIIAVLAIVVVLGFGGGFVAAGLLGGSTPTPSPSDPTTAVAGAGASPTAPVPTDTIDETGATPSPSADAATEPPAAAPPTQTEGDVAIVPVTNFRSGRSAVKPADLRAIPGGDGIWSGLVLVKSDADAILDSLGLARADLGKSLITVATAADLKTNLAKNRTRVAFLRADEVDASVRTLDWASKSLFGINRVKDLAAWPLTARVTVSSGDPPAYDPKTAWTILAGGDILLDRGVALAVKSKGVDFPFNGGTADITGICKDCSPFGWDLPYTKRTGHQGVLRDLIEGADLAIANFENPAPNAYKFHSKGTVFSANPAYIKGLRNAGIDWVSLANNHIGDAGKTGILQTMANMDRYGIAYSGVGKNSKAAHKAALMKVGDVTVGLLGYDTIAGYYKAGTNTPGSARLTASAVKADVKAARKAGADLVIVFPHWGVEYKATPFAGQQKLARAAIDAGADMVIGNHAHWAGAMEVHDGKPIWYALGNFVFDQTWSIPTMEGVTLELTFNGTDLVQAKMRPHLILDKAQPNLLDPLGDGKSVLSQIFRGSKGILPW